MVRATNIGVGAQLALAAAGARGEADTIAGLRLARDEPVTALQASDTGRRPFDARANARPVFDYVAVIVTIRLEGERISARDSRCPGSGRREPERVCSGHEHCGGSWCGPAAAVAVPRMWG